MRVVFMGSPEFSVNALKSLHVAGHEIIAVYSQPPRPKGRGQGVEKTAVHMAAEELGFEVHTPATFKDADAVQAFQDLNADVAVVAAYGLILRKPILEAPKFGCINIHASLLPRWRGAAPIQRAIEAGDAETGITIMQMDVGLDTGSMLLKGAMPIALSDTAQNVHDRLSVIGAELIVQALSKLEKGDLPPEIQPEEGVTYAQKMQKSESIIDWTHSAEAIQRKLRAFTPWPGLQTIYKGEVLRVHQVEAVAQSGMPGAVIGLPLVVACGDKALSIKRIQRAGKNVQDIDVFVRGFPFAVAVGDVLGA